MTEVTPPPQAPERPAPNTIEGQMKAVTERMRDPTNSAEAGLRMISTGYIEALKDPNKLGMVAVSYRSAQEAAARIDQGGEANKVLFSLEAMHNQAGLAPYEIRVQVPQGANAEVRGKAVRDKLKTDLAEVPDKLAGKYIEGTVRARADFAIEEGRAREVISRPEFSRPEVRRAAYGLADSRDKFVDVAGDAARRVGGEKFASEVEGSYREQWKYEPEVLEGEFKDLPDNEKNKQIDASVGNYMAELGEKGDKTKLVALGSMSEASKRESFTEVANLDRQIGNARRNLEQAINSDPAKACELANKVKELQLARKYEMGRVRCDLAKQRVENASRNWKGLAEQLAKGKLKGAGGKFAAAAKERISARLSLYKERLSTRLAEPVIDRLKDRLDKVGEEISVFAQEIDDIVIKPAREGIELAKGKIQGAKTATGGEFAGVKGQYEIAKLEVKKRLLQKRYETELTFQGAKREIAMRAEVGVRKSKSKVGELLGGEEARKKAGEHRKRLEKAGDRLSQRYEKEFKEKAKDNPYFKVFDDDLKKRVKWVETPAAPAEQKSTTVAAAQVTEEIGNVTATAEAEEAETPTAQPEAVPTAAPTEGRAKVVEEEAKVEEQPEQLGEKPTEGERAKEPTLAELQEALAQAQVNKAAAEARLTTAKRGGELLNYKGKAELRIAQDSLEAAELSLESAQANLESRMNKPLQ